MIISTLKPKYPKRLLVTFIFEDGTAYIMGEINGFYPSKLLRPIALLSIQWMASIPRNVRLKANKLSLTSLIGIYCISITGVFPIKLYSSCKNILRVKTERIYIEKADGCNKRII